MYLFFLSLSGGSANDSFDRINHAQFSAKDKYDPECTERFGININGNY